VSESEKTIQEECYGTCWGAQQRIDELTQQLNLANERIKRLEEAGDAMDPMNDTECECDDRSVLICKYCFDSSTRWFKAKEAKP